MKPATKWWTSAEVAELQAALADMIALCRHKASNRDEEMRVEAAVAVLTATKEDEA